MPSSGDSIHRPLSRPDPRQVSRSWTSRGSLPDGLATFEQLRARPVPGTNRQSEGDIRHFENGLIPPRAWVRASPLVRAFYLVNHEVDLRVAFVPVSGGRT